MIMMMMSDLWFPIWNGRTTWEVKKRAGLKIGELLYSDVGMGKILDVGVEVA